MDARTDRAGHDGLGTYHRTRLRRQLWALCEDLLGDRDVSISLLWHRASSKLKRVFVIGHSGFVSLEALRWIRAVGAAFVQVESGELIAASVGAGPDFAALRRTQALAAESSAGLEIARLVLRLKIEGQRELLHELPGDGEAIEPVERALREIDRGETIGQLLAAEALAAERYWRAWAPLPVRFPRRDVARVPEHWLTFGQRASLLTGGPRSATNPANAVLNYVYDALLRAETTLACHAVGLDPGIGVFHRDTLRPRHSLALDLMEAARPAVDAYVLALLTQRTLSARDFVETRDGACRITPRLAEQLADTCGLWRSHVAPVVEWTANTLATHARSRVPSRSPLTRAHHRAALDARLPDRQRRQSRASFPALPATCRDCDAELTDRRRRYCDRCRSQRWAQQAERGRANAASVLARLRSEQRDPAHGGRATEIRGQKNAAHQRAVRHWEGPRADPAVFRSEIRPAISALSINDLVAATGLSSHYCSLIRLGKRVPHARHWEALRRLGS